MKNAATYSTMLEYLDPFLFEMPKVLEELSQGWANVEEINFERRPIKKGDHVKVQAHYEGQIEGHVAISMSTGTAERIVKKMGYIPGTRETNERETAEELCKILLTRTLSGIVECGTSLCFQHPSTPRFTNPDSYFYSRDLVFVNIDTALGRIYLDIYLTDKARDKGNED